MPFMGHEKSLEIHAILDSIEVSIPACHAGDPGSIPGRGVTTFLDPKNPSNDVTVKKDLCCPFLKAVFMERLIGYF